MCVACGHRLSVSPDCHRPDDTLHSRRPDDVILSSSHRHRLGRLIMAPAQPKSFHLPAFQSKDVRLWFLQAEATFRMNNVKDQQTMFDSVITALDVNAATDIADILTHPPDEEPYDALKKALVDRLAVSNAARIKRVLSNLSIGDRSPSAHLRRLRSEAGNNFSDAVLKTIWLDALPADVKLVVSGLDLDLDKLAATADRVHDVAGPRRVIASVSSTGASSSGTSSSGPSSSAASSSASSSWTTQMEQRTRQLASVVKRLDDRGRKKTKATGNGGPPAKKARSRSRSTNPDDADDSHCWYHRRFKEKARKCVDPCTATWPLSTSSSTSSSGNGQDRQ